MFIKPKTDFAFKKIFGSKKSKDILISFLNAILYQEKPTTADLEILGSDRAPRIKGIKDSSLDVKATLTGNKTVIVEMQVLKAVANGIEALESLIIAYEAAGNPLPEPTVFHAA